MITANPQYTTKRICSLMVTHSCNLHCVYCFEKYKSKGLKFMSLNTAQKILNKEFEDFSNKDRLPSDRLAIEFFGGEPLLNFDLIQNIYEWTDSLNLTFPFNIPAHHQRNIIHRQYATLVCRKNRRI